MGHFKTVDEFGWYGEKNENQELVNNATKWKNGTSENVKETF